MNRATLIPALRSSSSTDTLRLLGPRVHTTCSTSSSESYGVQEQVARISYDRCQCDICTRQPRQNTLVLQVLGVACPDKIASSPSCTILPANPPAAGRGGRQLGASSFRSHLALSVPLPQSIIHKRSCPTSTRAQGAESEGHAVCTQWGFPWGPLLDPPAATVVSVAHQVRGAGIITALAAGKLESVLSRYSLSPRRLLRAPVCVIWITRTISSVACSPVEAGQCFLS